jgi:hypothetical protein
MVMVMQVVRRDTSGGTRRCQSTAVTVFEVWARLRLDRGVCDQEDKRIAEFRSASRNPGRAEV